MTYPLALDLLASSSGPFMSTEVKIKDGSSGFVVTRRSVQNADDKEVYFIPAEPEHSDIVCTYVAALLNQLSVQYPEIVSLQAMG